MSVRIPFNFSSEPFQRNRPVVAASLAAISVLACTLGILCYWGYTDRDLASGAREQVAKLSAQQSKLAQEQAAVEARLRRRDYADVLERNAFLNVLLYRKGISWTRIFEDIESTLPHNVRLISVRPQVTPNNELLLDMVVGAQSNEPVIELLMRLEASPLFGATSVQSWLPPSQNEPLYRYRVSVNYVQKL
jgi:type IV pilus assembly protein PilN